MFKSPFFILILLIAIACSGPVCAASSDFQVDYDVYAGGVHLLDITQDFNQTTSQYGSVLMAKPSGFFNKVVPWEGRYATTGVIRNNQLIPQRHSKSSRWSNERDETVMQFDAKGNLTRMTSADWVVGKAKPPAKDMTPDPALSKNALDLVTAVLALLQHAQQVGPLSAASCQNSQTVFDGKRRFTIQFSDLGKSSLAKSDYNAFSGPARHCQIEIKPLAGFPRKNRGYYKIQEDSRAHGQLPSLWLMPAYTGGPPIPVRMLIKSEYGAILVHATKVVRK